jgi:hypothetical protein
MRRRGRAASARRSRSPSVSRTRCRAPNGIRLVHGQQHLAGIAQDIELPDDLDRVGLAEREIEDDQIRGGFAEHPKHRRRRLELLRRKTDCGQDFAHDRQNLRLIVQDVGAREARKATNRACEERSVA